jgi:hypothetical protein
MLSARSSHLHGLGPFDSPPVARHLHIDIEDDEDANLLIELPRIIQFIKESVVHGRVLVHWCVTAFAAVVLARLCVFGPLSNCYT